MAAKPSSVFSWATTGGTRLEPTAPEKAAGFAASDKPPARWLNWLWGSIGDWIAYLDLSGSSELTYATSRARLKMIPVTSGVPGNVSSGASYAYAGTHVELKSVGGVGGNASWVVPLHLPHGSVLKLVTCGVECDAVHPGTLTMTVTERTPSTSGTIGGGSSTTLGSPDTTVGTSGEVLTSGTMTVAVDAETKVYAVSIVSSGVADASERIYWLRVSYEESRATGTA